MTSILTPEQRRPACDCKPSLHPAIAAHVLGCAIDSGPSRDELLEHADAMDEHVERLQAGRDDLYSALEWIAQQPRTNNRGRSGLIGHARKVLKRVDALAVPA